MKRTAHPSLSPVGQEALASYERWLREREDLAAASIPWAISSKNMRRELGSLMSVLTICGIASAIAWRSPSRYTDWHKSWGTTHWTRPSSTSREPSTICNKRSKRSHGHNGRDHACVSSQRGRLPYSSPTLRGPRACFSNWVSTTPASWTSVGTSCAPHSLSSTATRSTRGEKPSSSPLLAPPMPSRRYVLAHVSS